MTTNDFVSLSEASGSRCIGHPVQPNGFCFLRHRFFSDNRLLIMTKFKRPRNGLY